MENETESPEDNSNKEGGKTNVEPTDGSKDCSDAAQALPDDAEPPVLNTTSTDDNESSKETGGEDKEKGNNETVIVPPFTKVDEDSVREVWKGYFNSKEFVCRHMFGRMTQDFKHLLKFEDTLCRLHKAALEGADSFVKHYGTSYRWIRDVKEAMESEGSFSTAADFMEELLKKEVYSQQRLPAGSSCILQLEGHGKWWDWLEIRKSGIVQGGVGVFACREFPRNQLIGFYTGVDLWTATEDNIEEPNDKHLQALKVKDSEHSITVRNSDMRWCVREARATDFNRKENLYMGLHYINNVTQCFETRTSLYESAKSKMNCTILEDSCVFAEKKISNGQELFTAYKVKDMVPVEAFPFHQWTDDMPYKKPPPDVKKAGKKATPPKKAGAKRSPSLRTSPRKKAKK